MGVKMKTKLCEICNSRMVRNGKTSSGRQRWRCVKCGSSSIHKNRARSRDLEMFVKWLLSRRKQDDMPCGGRTFRRKIAGFWELWPLPRPVDEIHRVIYVDGIWLSRSYVVLIACTEKYVLSWTLARRENTESWMNLLRTIAPPDMVVCDGGSGFKAACKQVWPKTKIQRCIFHVHAQIRRYLTNNPMTGAGKELLKLSKRLLSIETLHEAQMWIEDFIYWLEYWHEFINELNENEDNKTYKHERLRKAQRALSTLLRSNTMFTYLDPALYDGMPRPKTNNVIEGGINAQLREMIHLHRGMSTTRRIKAIFWWCYMHMECPDTFSDILKNMPTDKDIDALQKHYSQVRTNNICPAEYDTGLSWNDLHTSDLYSEWN